MKKLFRLTLSLFIGLSLHAGQQTLEDVSINLKWFYQYQFAGMIMAKEKGFYKEEGLNVRLIERDPSKDHIKQVIEGEAEYGIADSSILMYRAKGFKVKIVSSIFQHNAMVLIAKKESNIVSPYEMKGKKISYQNGIDDAIFGSMFNFANLKEEDYIHVPMDFTYERFINDEIDVIAAYVTDQPYWITNRGYELNIINPLSYGIDLYGDILFTTENEIAKHPKRVEAIKKATLRGWKYALDNKEETIDIIRKQYKPDLSYDQLMYEAKMTEHLIAANFVALGHTSIDRFKMIAEIFSHMENASINMQQAVDELIYDPNNELNQITYYFKIFVAVFLLMLLIALALYWNNKRLTFLVKEQTQKLEHFNEQIKKLMDMQNNMLLLSDGKELHFANQAFFDFFGCEDLDDFTSKYTSISKAFIPAEQYFFVPNSNIDDSWIGSIMELSGNKRIVSMLDKDAIPYAFAVSIRQFDDLNYIINFTDISSTIEEQIQLEKRATHDALTGAYNREYFSHYANRIKKRIHLEHKRIGLIMIDIDFFKSVNDTYGHQRGDEVLKSFTQQVKLSIRDSDTVIRWGGEEFLIIVAVHDPLELGLIAQNIRKKIASSHFEEVEHLTCSLGCTIYDDSENISLAIERADTALYQAKASGRNCVKTL